MREPAERVSKLLKQKWSELETRANAAEAQAKEKANAVFRIEEAIRTQILAKSFSCKQASFVNLCLIDDERATYLKNCRCAPLKKKWTKRFAPCHAESNQHRAANTPTAVSKKPGTRNPKVVLG